MKEKLPGLTGIVLCLLVASGCASSGRYAPMDRLKVASAVQREATYKIGPGDEIDIKFLAVPEINDRLIVAPDGAISLMFAPNIKAAGLTVEQLMKRIKAALKSHVKHADMVIVLRSFVSQRAFVNGEVTRPGPVLMNGPETILQVLSEAGWVTPSAGTDSVLLIRGDSENPNRENVYRVDVSRLIDGTDMSQNVLVRAGDVVLVPPSGAVVADRWVDQHIRQMLPLNTSAGVSYNFNPNTSIR